LPFDRIMRRKLISVVSPAFNEQDCVDELVRRLSEVAAKLEDRYDFEFIIVENGSVDETYLRLLRLRERDERVKIIRFSRNFGAEGAVTAALHHAKGDAAVIMSADLQDPPELIPDFVALWEQGYENIYGIIERRTDEDIVRRMLTKVFYRILSKLNTVPVPENVSDFRLVSRPVYETLNKMTEKHRMMRTMWGWIGFKSVGVPFVRPPRFGGKSTYKLLRNVNFAIHGILASSVTPLKVIPIFGLSISGISFALLAVLAIRWIFLGVPFPGFGTIVALMLGSMGLIFLFLGIISEYIGMIFEEVRQRPHYVVADSHGLDEFQLPEFADRENGERVVTVARRVS
jgi:glycosyltransferase involved in cell wall biosynthesis